MRIPSARPLLLGLACVSAMACVKVGPEPVQPWRLFSLTPLAEPEAEPAASTRSPGPVQSAIRVGPVHLAGYLDQDQIVTRISPNRFTLSDDNRWAEPLEDNIGHVLVQNLSVLLQNDQVSLNRWPGPRRPSYQLEIDVLSFETDSAGRAQLMARWFLRDVESRQTIAEKETSLTVAAAGGSTEQSVAALSQALGDFSVEIAKVICESVQGRSEPISERGCNVSDGSGSS
jgi:uncharacterized lipoprotein YmbA